MADAAVPVCAVSTLERRLCSSARPCQRKTARLLQQEVTNMRIAARGGGAHAVDVHGARLQLPATRHACTCSPDPTSWQDCHAHAMAHITKCIVSNSSGGRPPELRWSGELRRH